MTSRYVLRLQVDPAADPAGVGDRLLAMVRSARAEEICVFLFGMEYNDGHDSLDGIDHWLTATRPWRTVLRAEGIAVSLNPGHTVGHSDWARSLAPDQAWQRMTDQSGKTAAAQVCPLDPAWRAYYAETLRRYAAEDVDAVWIEDDIRLHNHRPLDWGGCFCELHLAEFTRRTGIATTLEELVAACTAPGDPHAWRGRWLDFWDATQRTVQLSAVLDWISDASHARATGHPWLVTQALTDERTWCVVIWNASPDEADDIRVRLPVGMPEPATAVQVTARGTRIPVGWRDGGVILEQPLGQWEYVVLSTENWLVCPTHDIGRLSRCHHRGLGCCRRISPFRSHPRRGAQRPRHDASDGQRRGIPLRPGIRREPVRTGHFTARESSVHETPSEARPGLRVFPHAGGRGLVGRHRGGR
ncbi:hypothetical protein P8A21_36965 [Streptomyces poriferorum]|uniref:hypothetical protein n=1 Tax=Streptomyces poriferorum TaxID=2798799 RepID=UPI0027400ADF|nr:hypothetical protein [Streptomyces sp. Alt1]WLQ52742.1 hypothetical protein P8A21_36965 [Streptomyces sp. Alt1]